MTSKKLFYHYRVTKMMTKLGFILPLLCMTQGEAMDSENSVSTTQHHAGQSEVPFFEQNGQESGSFCSFHHRILASSWKDTYVTQLSSLSILPFWFPWLTNSLNQRAQIISSTYPNNSLRVGFSNYRGIMANLPIQFLYPLVKWEMGFLQEKMQKSLNRELNFFEQAMTGFMTGASTVLFTNPYEVTVIRAQQAVCSARYAFKSVYAENGFKGLYTGSLAMMLRNGTFATSLFLGAPACATWLKKNVDSVTKIDESIDTLIPMNAKGNNLTASFLGAIIPAAVANTVAIPVDLAMIMRQADPGRQSYTTFGRALIAAYQRHGIHAFKAGVFSRLIATTIELAGFNILYNYYSQE